MNTLDESSVAGLSRAMYDRKTSVTNPTDVTSITRHLSFIGVILCQLDGGERSRSGNVKPKIGRASCRERV